MPDPTKQLSAIPFGHLIGAPLTAAVEAQAKAAQSTLGFIQTVGFEKSGEKTKTRTVTFTYKRDGKDTELIVPILTIVPIPFIRIDDMSIDFKASLSASNETEKVEGSTTEAKASLSASANYLWASAKLDASYSSKKDSKSTANSKYSVEYTVDIHVHAVQDDMPAGLAEVLKMMTESIKSQPNPAVTAQQNPNPEE